MNTATEQRVIVARARDYSSSGVQAALRELFLQWDLDPENPLGAIVPEGSRVLIKPNWVLHYNQSGAGLDCLITHTSLIAALLPYIQLARPASIVIGDAPVQGCDFGALRAACGIDAVSGNVVDFRRTVLREHERKEQIRGLDQYVLFDLGRESLLEPLSTGESQFRVTMYNPDYLSRTHRAGRHQYLIAREAIDADVVFNLPKLKCHKKAGITGALKNLVGINGNKEYLPHHRKGGSTEGGDCYFGSSWLKRHAEDLCDTANRRQTGRLQSLLAASAEWIIRGATVFGEDDNLEGSWYGNDTVWRMTLDLQRVLRYGRADGSLSNNPQRVVMNITDAIIGGEGEGPLAATPIPSGFLTGALNSAAAEWVHARLMGFDPTKIPVVRHAFDPFSYPLTTFASDAITVRMDSRELRADNVMPAGRPFRPPKGWAGHCELETQNDHAGEPAVVA